MKLSLVVLSVVLAVAQSERLCRSNCDSTAEQDDGTSDGCFCDPACVDAGDCCDSYFDFCADAGCAEVDACGSSETFNDANGSCFCDAACVDAGDCCDDYAAECGGDDDDACLNCPDDAQTLPGSRTSCYCDDACVDAGDCCPSYFTYCGDAIVSSDRAAFCNILEASKSAFCDNGIRKAYWFDIEAKIDSSPSSKTDAAWALDAFNRTCLLDPEVVEDTVETCYSSPDFNWRYGCSGLNTMFAQPCDSSSCRDSSCDSPWRRDYWGMYSSVGASINPIGGTGPEKEFPIFYDGAEGAIPSQAGRCEISFDDTCSADDGDRVSAWVYGCSDEFYTDVEFLDWEDLEGGINDGSTLALQRNLLYSIALDGLEYNARELLDGSIDSTPC